MISVDEAIAIILQRTSTPSADSFEHVSLLDSLGRVLAAPVVAKDDLPLFSRSTVDGFAVRAADAPLFRDPGLRIVGESAAGMPSGCSVGAGEAVKIFTGAKLPSGADAVIMVEDSTTEGDHVRFGVTARAGQNYSKQGEDLKRGDTALCAGDAISSGAIGLLASLGATSLGVRSRPRVAILPTGTELVRAHETPQEGQIRESNAAVLAALIHLAGCEPVDLGIVRDDRARIKQAAERGLECDVLLVSGGSSVGDYDFTPEILAELGVEVHFDRVNLKPGKPTLFGTRGDRAVFGLPGNPISAFVTFHLFVRPALLVRAGLPASPPPRLGARLLSSVKRSKDRDQALPAALTIDPQTYDLAIRFVGWHGSGDVTCLSDANALLFVPRGDGALEAGEIVRATPLDGGRMGDFAMGFAS